MADPPQAPAQLSKGAEADLQVDIEVGHLDVIVQVDSVLSSLTTRTSDFFCALRPVPTSLFATVPHNIC